MLIPKDIIKATREAYEIMCGYVWNGYTAPELRPQLSRQIKCLTETLVEHTNGELAKLKRRIVELENALN